MKKRITLLFVSAIAILAMVISSGAVAVFADNDAGDQTIVDTGIIGEGDAGATDAQAAPLYEGLDEFEKLASNKSTELYMLHRKNSLIVFAVKDVASGEVTYSVPAKSTSIKSEDVRDEVTSAAILNYQDKSKVSQKCLTTDAIKAGDYQVTKIENGVRILFKFPGAKEGRGFEMPMTFVLKDDHFDVSVEMNKIKQDKASESEILSISVMPYYGCAEYGEEGYVFIPDGSGALMENSFLALDGGVKYYSAYVYGRDSALDTTRKIGHTEPTVLPVFGTKADERAWLGVIARGEAVAMVKAVSARESFPFTTAYCEFLYNKTDVFKTKNAWNVVDYEQVTLEHTDLDNATMRYYVMHGDKADYVGMAQTYREYLIEQGVGSTISADVPFYVETMGAFQKKESVFGFVTDVTKVSTDFKQAKTMVEYLSNKDIKNINLRYVGWMKGGADGSVVTNANLESKLGTTADLLALNKYIESQGGTTFLELEIVNIYRAKSGWSANKFSIRNILNNHAEQYIFHRSTGMPSDYKHYLSKPSLYKTQVDKFFADYDDLKAIKGISAGSLAENNYSDFNNSHESFADAQQTSDLMSAALANIEKNVGKDGKVMVDTGNAFSYKNADVVAGLPMYCNGYEFTYTDVPFAQIALHGLITYAETAHNLTFDTKTQLLRQLETGTAPYYVLTDSESAVFLNTRYNAIFTSQYKTWADAAAKDYKILASVLNGYCDKPITDHDIITNDVRATVYGGERVVLVNYSEADYAIGDKTVLAGSYLVMTASEYSAITTTEGGVEQ